MEFYKIRLKQSLNINPRFINDNSTMIYHVGIVDCHQIIKSKSFFWFRFSKLSLIYLIKQKNDLIFTILKDMAQIIGRGFYKGVTPRGWILMSPGPVVSREVDNYIYIYSTYRHNHIKILDLIPSGQGWNWQVLDLIIE